MQTTKGLREKYGFTREEKNFLEESNTANTAEMNESKIMSEFILGKRMESAAKNIKMSVDFLNTSASESANDIRLSAQQINESVEKVGKSIDNFNNTVQDIGNSSDKLSKNIVFLNWILVIATSIAAVATLLQAYMALYEY